MGLLSPHGIHSLASKSLHSSKLIVSTARWPGTTSSKATCQFITGQKLKEIPRLCSSLQKPQKERLFTCNSSEICCLFVLTRNLLCKHRKPENFHFSSTHRSSRVLLLLAALLRRAGQQTAMAWQAQTNHPAKYLNSSYQRSSYGRLLSTQKERTPAVLSHAYNTINKVTFESLCHLTEVLNTKPFDSLVSPFLPGTNKQDSPEEREGPSCLFKGLWELSQKGARMQQNFPCVGTSQRQPLSALKLQDRKSYPFQLQKATVGYQARQLKRDSSLFAHQTGNPIYLLIITYLTRSFLTISRVSLTSGPSSLC